MVFWVSSDDATIMMMGYLSVLFFVTIAFLNRMRVFLTASQTRPNYLCTIQLPAACVVTMEICEALAISQQKTVVFYSW